MQEQTISTESDTELVPGVTEGVLEADVRNVEVPLTMQTAAGLSQSVVMRPRTTKTSKS